MKRILAGGGAARRADRHAGRRGRADRQGRQDPERAGLRHLCRLGLAARHPVPRAFPDLRANLQSMLLASRQIGLSSNVSGHDLPAPDLVVTGRVAGLGLTASKASGADSCVGGTRAVASLDLRVRDALSGATLFGGNVTKSVALSSNIVAGGGRCSTLTPDDASYDRVEGALALTAARAVLFHIAPLRVTGISGRHIALNYGTPILTLGTRAQVTGAGGFPLRYQVVAATAEAAFAEPDGEAGPVDTLKLRIPERSLNNADSSRQKIGLNSVSQLADQSDIERQADAFTHPIDFDVQPTDDGSKVFAETENGNPMFDFAAEVIASDLLRSTIENAQRQQQLEQDQQQAAQTAAQAAQRVTGLTAAKADDQLANPTIDAQWKALPRPLRAQLLAAQRAWSAKKDADCRVQAAAASIDPSEMEAARLTCDARSHGLAPTAGRERCNAIRRRGQPPRHAPAVPPAGFLAGEALNRRRTNGEHSSPL